MIGRARGSGGWTTSWATLLAVLVLYFAVPLEAGPAPARLAGQVVERLHPVGAAGRGRLRMHVQVPVVGDRQPSLPVGRDDLAHIRATEGVHEVDPPV